jgi:ABC-2 type transport system permease protein
VSRAGRALLTEAREVLADRGALLILVGAVVVYAFFYPTPYLNQVLKDVPVVVVDLDRSALSRQLTRMTDANERIAVAAVVAEVAEGERRVRAGEAGGLLVIPGGFERKIRRGEPAVVGAFADAAYFLVFSQALTGMLESAGTLSAGISIARLEASGLSPKQARAMRDPVPLLFRPLFNPAEGYAVYVVPAVLILILQQTLLIGIGMRGPAPVADGGGPASTFGEALGVVIGRGAVFLSLGFVNLFFYLAVVEGIYGFPRKGSPAALALFALPFLLATVALGLALTTFFSRRESAMQVLLVTSLPAVFMASFSWPPESIPGWVRGLATVLPTSAAIPGFLRINQMGASLSQVRGEWAALWCLVVVYVPLAAWLQLRRWRADAAKP